MLSVPVAINRVTPDNIDAHIAEFKRIHAGRVFLCLFKNFMDDTAALKRQLDIFRLMRDKLHASGIEAGIWLDDLGHGACEIGYKEANKRYTPLEGVFSKSKDSFCPLDEKFQKDYASYIKVIAEAKPDIIMLDDDYRFSVRNYGIGCFCKLHRKIVFDKIGKRYTKLALFNKIFTGKPNAVRDAWMDACGESLLSFAKVVRKAVDSVDENIRLGCCMCLDTLDLAGTDALTLAKAFAGKTKPYFRTSGAPYWHAMSGWGDSRAVAEYTRQETAWFDGEDVEMFAEGDVYPRPRYVVPANYLECYDAYLRADGKCGVLKYMFDYNYELGYETGYLDHHVKNYDVIQKIGESFRSKKQIGVELFEPMKKTRDFDFDKTYLPQKDFLLPPPGNKLARFFDGFIRKPYYAVASYVEKMQTIPTLSFGRAQRLVAANGIPTLYTPSDGAVVCFGESARHLPESYLSRGVMLDMRAAKIMTERGIDVGYVAAERNYDNKEEFPFGTDLTIDKCRYLYSLSCKEGAEVVSRYQPSGKVASFLYLNKEGQSFFVVGIDGEMAPQRGDDKYFSNYYRARSVRENLERVSKKKLIAYCEKNINLSLLCAKGDDGTVAVGLFNFFADGIAFPKIAFSEPITRIECINCSASFSDGEIGLLTEIPPYGFACILVHTSSSEEKK